MSEPLIKELKFLPEKKASNERAYYRCHKHGRYAFRDYLPYSLQNPIIGSMACGCSGAPRDRMVAVVDDQEGMRGLLAQHEADLAAEKAREAGQ